MARTTSFTKRSLIGKANSTMVIATSIAAFVLVFALFAGKSLISQMGYQNKVISEKKEALTQIENNLQAVDTLKNSYKDFVDESPNVLGGDPDGTGAPDGDNAKLVLDALPSKYDFPALTTSLEFLITSQNLQILGISGTDEEVTQAQQTDAEPVAIPMPFQVQVNGAYSSVQSLVDVLLRSVRPFQVQSIELSGDESSMIATIAAQTFYQPGKVLTIKEEVVR